MKAPFPAMRCPLLLAALALTTWACRDSTGPAGPGPKTDAGTMTGLECPGDGITICALKLTSSARHPMIGEPVTLTGVVVTTATVSIGNLDVFYVQDPAGADFLDGRYSGIAVVYSPMELVGRVPPIGTKITVEGVYAEFGQTGFDQQKQVRAARVESMNELATISPVTVSSPNLIAKGGADSAAYEGVLVKVDTVTVREIDLMVNGNELFNAFRLEGDLVVSGQFYVFRGPIVGEIFSNITGVLRVGSSPFEAGEYLISPRAEAELVPQNPRVVISSVEGINNASSPSYIRDICTQDRNSGFSCPKVELRRVLVTAVDGYVSANLRALWVQDPNDADGLYAGIKVVYNPMRTQNIPQVGQFIDVDGEVLSYFGTRQVQFPTFTRNGTDTMTPTPKVIVSDRIGQQAATAIEHMGTLVRIEGVSVIDRCLEGSNGSDFGGWLVTGNVQIGPTFSYDYNGSPRPMGTMCQDQQGMPTGACACEGANVVMRPGDQRRDGDNFTSITGVVDNAFSANQLLPRSAADLVKAQ